MRKPTPQYDIFNHFGPMRLDRDELLDLVAYDKRTGLFYKRGDLKPLGHFDTDGYVRISIFKRSLYAHRLAWFYTYGKWPIFFLDHKNRLKFDNRIKNLRDVTQRVNRIVRGPISEKTGPFNANGRKHYDFMADLLKKEGISITFS